MGKKNRKNKSNKNTSRGGSSNGSSLAAGFRRAAKHHIDQGVAESFAKMEQLDRYDLAGQKAIIRDTLTFIGTDCDTNDSDPTGDGDQSRIQSEQQAEKARELYSIGGDIHKHAMEGAFSDLGMSSIIGNVGRIRDLIHDLTKSIQEKQSEPWYVYSSSDCWNEMIALLETRDTSMRLSPLLLIVSAGKNVPHQPFMDHKGAAKLLLKSGANPYAKDVLGKTVAHYGAGAMATPMTLEVVDMCVHAAKSFHLFGKEVELHGLKANHMNGLRGFVGGFDPDSGRRVVYVLENKKEVWVKPANIRLVDSEEGNNAVDHLPMLLDVQDRMGAVSLMEVVMQNRTDVAEFLLVKHNTSIHTEDMDGCSPLKMSTMGGHMMAGGVCRMITDVTRREAKQSRDAKKEAIERSCANCKKRLDENAGANRCSSCKNAFYCNRECQVAHWNNGHKAECKKISAIVEGVKLKPPSGQYAFGSTISMVSGKTYSQGSYRMPDGASPDEKFVVKVQGGSEIMPIMIYDETRTCEFTLPPGQPGFKEVLAEIKKETAWFGRKTFMKASFDSSGNCTIYPATAGVKSKYTW